MPLVAGKLSKHIRKISVYFHNFIIWQLIMPGLLSRPGLFGCKQSFFIQSGTRPGVYCAPGWGVAAAALTASGIS